MKLTNAQLAISLEEAVSIGRITGPEREAMLRLAQGLIDYPTSDVRTAEALGYLHIAPEEIPAELWPATAPLYVPSVRAFSVAIDNLNAVWDKPGVTVATRLVALRRVKWYAAMTIKAIEDDIEQRIGKRILDNKGSRRGIISKASDNRQGKRKPKTTQAAVSTTPRTP